MNNGILNKFSLPNNTYLIIGHIPTITRDLSQERLDEYHYGHSLERALQLATADYLVDSHFGARTEIRRLEDGKPYLLNRDEHISISHTGECMAMIIGSKSVAVDIEIQGRRIDRIFHRFTNNDEFNRIDSLVDTDSLLMLWSVKECLFKIVPHQGILFKEHLIISNCSSQNNSIISTADVKHPQLEKRFVVKSFIFEPLVISYIIEDEV